MKTIATLFVTCCVFGGCATAYRPPSGTVWAFQRPPNSNGTQMTSYYFSSQGCEAALAAATPAPKDRCRQARVIAPGEGWGVEARTEGAVMTGTNQAGCEVARKVVAAMLPEVSACGPAGIVFLER